jgi:hypothetical protein
MAPGRDDTPIEGDPLEAEAESEADPESEGEPEAAGDEAGGGFDTWRRDSALGAVGTGIARGLHAVFAPPVHEIAIVAAVPGEPPDADQRVRVVLDPDDPTKSVAIMPQAPSDPPPP